MFKRNVVIDIKVNEKVVKAYIYRDGDFETVYPFMHQPIEICYDEHGYEQIKEIKKLEKTIRFCPEKSGEYFMECYDENDCIIQTKKFNVVDSSAQSRLKIDRGEAWKDDGTYFLPIGINLTYPDSFKESKGVEFKTNDKVVFLGLKQYESWIKRCAGNGVNLIRIWGGSSYFTPDKVELGEYDYKQFSKLDKVFEIANKYKVRIKLTIEKLRHFVSIPQNIVVEGQAIEGSNLFDFYHTYQGEIVTDSAWINERRYRNLWLLKLREYQLRYACNPALYAIEFWNEMNNYGHGSVNMEELNDWNCCMAENARKLFPNALILNSFGSLDCSQVAKLYESFRFELFDWFQFHSYLDQGAGYKEVCENPIEAIKKSSSLLKEQAMKNNQKLFLAETGAVNDCHSGPFRYYMYDNDGLIFVDCVYTPLFLGCIGAGNIWHWGNQYVGAKNLYKYFKPLSLLVSGIDFSKEKFAPLDLSDKQVYCFVLKGETQYLAFIRNKEWNWKNTLRDGKNGKIINGQIEFDAVKAETLQTIKIWNEEHNLVYLENNTLLNLKKLGRGILLKGTVRKDG